ncbi:MAG: PAS domain S-box protein [Haloarculaceae archaeon]
MTDRVAVCLDHEENRRHLTDQFRADLDYEPVPVADPPDAGEADACVVDLPALVQHREWLAARKEREHPHFFPVLLVHDSEARPLGESLWEVIDETIETPIRVPELDRRLANLLQRRRLSSDLTDDLERAERRYRAIFEAVNDALLIVDPATDSVVECNPRATSVLGYDRATLQSLSPAEDLHPDSDAYRAFLDRVRRTGQARTDALACTRSDGTTIEAEISASVLDDRGEERVVVSIRDVTERRERQRQVERQRDRLGELNRITRTLHETTRAVVGASSRADLESEVCRRLAASEVYQFAWIGHRQSDEAVAPRATGGDAAAYLDHVDLTTPNDGPTARALRTGSVATVQDAATAGTMAPWRAALAEFDVRSTASVPIQYAGDEFGVLNLYTNRADAFSGDEREILADLGRTIGRAIVGIQAHERAQLFRQAVEHAGHAVYITRPDGQIEYVNAAFEDVTGYASEEAVGRTPQILQSSEHDSPFYRDDWEPDRPGEVREREVVGQRKDGHRRHIDQTIAPIVDDEGEIEHFVAITRDITQQRRRRQQLQVLYRVLRHNLRNELNVVAGYAELLGERDPDPETRDAVARITGAVESLLQLSDHARRIEGTFVGDDGDREPRPLDAVLESAVEDVATAAATVEPSIPATGYRVAPELGVAVRELLTNAVEHSDADRPRATLTVATDVDDGVPRATVTVGDDGPGIPENERQVLREGEETPLLHGTGLGLWLVNWIVSELGGSVEIEDADRGSLVTLRLPVAE